MISRNAWSILKEVHVASFHSWRERAFKSSRGENFTTASNKVLDEITPRQTFSLPTKFLWVSSPRDIRTILQLLLLACTDFNGVKSTKRCAVRILELFVRCNAKRNSSTFEGKADVICKLRLLWFSLKTKLMHHVLGFNLYHYLSLSLLLLKIKMSKTQSPV